MSVVTVTPQTIPFVTSFVAQTESSQQVKIVARVSGFLDRIAYREGQLVKRGQLMFELDPKPFVERLNAAQGERAAQQARLETAQANYDRVKPLAEEQALSQADLDKAKGELDAATAAVFSAKAKLAEAQLNLGYATISSPVTGVASRAVQPQGAFVNAMSDSANLTYVAALDPIWVNFSLSQNQLARFTAEREKGLLVPPKDGDYDVEIVLPGGVTYPHHGKISFTDPSFSPDTGSFLVRAVFSNPEHALRPGMFVTAYVKGATRPNAIVVPQLSVLQGPNGQFVYVVNAEGIAEVRPVTVGDYEGEKNILILQGLSAGDRVIVDGLLKVAPGQPVKIVEPGTPGAAEPGKASAPAKK